MKSLKCSCKKDIGVKIISGRKHLVELSENHILTGYLEEGYGIKEKGDSINEIYILDRKRWDSLQVDQKICINIWTITNKGLLKGRIFGRIISGVIFFQEGQMLTYVKGIKAVSIGKEYFEKENLFMEIKGPFMTFRTNYVIN